MWYRGCWNVQAMQGGSRWHGRYWWRTTAIDISSCWWKAIYSKLPEVEGARGWGTLIFSSWRLGPGIYCLPPKISGISGIPKKIFEIKTSPFLWWPPKNIHKICIPQKIFIFLNPPPPPPPKKKKILKFKILNPKKWSEPTFVWEYQSTPPPTPTPKGGEWCSCTCKLVNQKPNDDGEPTKKVLCKHCSS